jgi:hypothetical protein
MRECSALPGPRERLFRVLHLCNFNRDALQRPVLQCGNGQIESDEDP